MEIRKIKKSQIKVQEMSFMILAVFLFFMLVILFYLSFSLSSLKKNVEISNRAKNVLLVQFLAGSPEFACPYSKMTCIDEDKLMALKTHVSYSTFWDVDGLSIERLFPKMNKTVECSLGNYPNCNKFTLALNKTGEKGIADASFVALCRREYKTYTYQKCELGKIIVWSK